MKPPATPVNTRSTKSQKSALYILGKSSFVVNPTESNPKNRKKSLSSPFQAAFVYPAELSKMRWIKNTISYHRKREMEILETGWFGRISFQFPDFNWSINPKKKESIRNPWLRLTEIPMEGMIASKQNRCAFFKNSFIWILEIISPIYSL